MNKHLIYYNSGEVLITDNNQEIQRYSYKVNKKVEEVYKDLVDKLEELEIDLKSRFIFCFNLNYNAPCLEKLKEVVDFFKHANIISQYCLENNIIKNHLSKEYDMAVHINHKIITGVLYLNKKIILSRTFMKENWLLAPLIMNLSKKHKVIITPETINNLIFSQANLLLDPKTELEMECLDAQTKEPKIVRFFLEEIINIFNDINIEMHDFLDLFINEIPEKYKKHFLKKGIFLLSDNLWPGLMPFLQQKLEYKFSYYKLDYEKALPFLLENLE